MVIILLGFPKLVMGDHKLSSKLLASFQERKAMVKRCTPMLTLWGWVKTHYCIPIFGEINIHEKHVFFLRVPRVFRVLAIGILKNIEPMKSNEPDIHVVESSVTGTSYFSFLRIEPLAPQNRWWIRGFTGESLAPRVLFLSLPWLEA